MQGENRDRIASLFEDALRCRGHERSELLARVGQEDAALEREVRSLLAAHERGGRFDAMADLMNQRELRRLLRYEPGEAIGPYRVVKTIGRGGMATVYLAHDDKHDRPVAIKVIHLSLAVTLGIDRFLREIEIASRLVHPHILPLFDSGEVDGLPFYVMPYVEGETLRDRLTREAPLSVRDTIRLTSQIASALTYAHERGIVHRDIKPANILLMGDQALVADFGIARAVAAAGEDRLTRTGQGMGTPAYMSPEQALGRTDIDTRTDVYSLGCVVHEMVGGRKSFETPISRQRFAKIPAPSVRLRSPNPEVPLFLERAVRRALAEHPDDRFQTPSEFADALTTGTIVARLGRRQRGRWLRRGVAATALLVAWALLPLVTAGSSVERIAVLPLANLTNEDEYLVEGVHEALISELAQLEIPVIARASMARYAGSSNSIRDIARELNVDGVIEGSIYRQGDSLEISARLYDGDTEEEVWSGAYDGDLPNVAALYRAFARAIAGEIDVTLGPEDEDRFRRSAPMDVDVYEAYLRGMHLLNLSTEEAFTTAMDYFHEAVERNPADPHAYAGLAFAYITLAHGPAPPPDALHHARAAAERAVRLDSTLAEGWAALADIRTYLTWEWEAAEEAFDRANALNPSMAINHYHRAWYLALFGRAEEAIASHERARELDPLTPLHTVWMPGLYSYLGMKERALKEARVVVQRYPDNATALYALGLAAAEMGEYDEAITAHRRAAAINPRWKGALGRSYAVAGRTDEAHAIVAELEAEPTSWNAYAVAEIHTALGDFDEAFRWLAFEPAHGWLPWSRISPTFAPLRTDERFEELMRRLNFVL